MGREVAVAVEEEAIEEDGADVEEGASDAITDVSDCDEDAVDGSIVEAAAVEDDG